MSHKGFKNVRQNINVLKIADRKVRIVQFPQSAHNILYIFIFQSSFT